MIACVIACVIAKELKINLSQLQVIAHYVPSECPLSAL